MNSIATTSSSVDLFADETLENPYPAYAELRELGDCVHLPKHDIWAVSRYAPAREVLKNWDPFSSYKGVGLVEKYNQYFIGGLIGTDPPDHDRLREVFASRTSPRAIRALHDGIASQADELVGDVVSRGEFDAVTDLAKAFPMSVVADLIGLPPEGRERLLEWADATFNNLGPENERAKNSVYAFDEVYAYVAAHATRDRLAPGSMGLSVYEALDRGDVAEDEVLFLLLAYLLPGMDTTVNAIGSAIHLFAQHPEQWERILADPSLISTAFDEVMRLESPLQLFSRVAKSETQLGDAKVPEGARVTVIFASGNRDERRWTDAESFDVGRAGVREHLGFGYGIHVCPGQSLARLEGQSILSALARRIVRFELTAEPERHFNNVLRGLAHLPVRIV